jgi:hypothetical protein
MSDKQECFYCHNKTVHPERYWKICLDCLITKLVEKGSIDINVSDILIKEKRS